MEQAQAFSVVRRRTRVTEDMIVKFYRNARGTSKPKWEVLDPAERKYTLVITPTGIGDCMMLTDIPSAARSAGVKIKAYSSSANHSILRKYTPDYSDYVTPFQIDLSAANAVFDIGPGHNFQRARRMFGLPCDDLPSGKLVVPNVNRVNRCSIHLIAGHHAQWQRRNIHSRARFVYDENIGILRRFIIAHPEIEFVEVGGGVLSDLIPSIGKTLDETIAWMSTATMHIGILSGPLHIAHALGLKTICIINFPNPWELMLPTVKNIDVVEAEWLYPQSCILHQDHDSAHWPKFSLETLEMALNGEVYPYWEPQKFHSITL